MKFPVDKDTIFTLKTELLDEMYCGRPTGQQVWHVLTLGYYGSIGAVLGRGRTEQEALNDWLFRANLDGYGVKKEQMKVVRRPSGV